MAAISLQLIEFNTTNTVTTFSAAGAIHRAGICRWRQWRYSTDSHYALQSLITTLAGATALREFADVRENSGGEQVSQNKPYVCGALCQSPHVPRKPELPIADQDDRFPSVTRQPQLLPSLNAVKHLELEAVPCQVLRLGIGDNLPDQLQIMSGDGRADMGSAGFMAEQFRGELKVILIHLRLARERFIRRLFVGAFHQTHGRSQGYQARQVFFRSVEIRLKADSHIRIFGTGAAENIQCNVRIIAGLHVNPNNASRTGALDDSGQILIAKLRAQIEAQLGQLDGKLRFQPKSADTAQHVEIMLGDPPCFCRIRHVLTQIGKNGTNRLVSEPPRAGQCVLLRFARHKPRDCTPDKPVSRRPLTQPHAL